MITPDLSLQKLCISHLHETTFSDALRSPVLGGFRVVWRVSFKGCAGVPKGVMKGVLEGFRGVSEGVSEGFPKGFPKGFHGFPGVSARRFI